MRAASRVAIVVLVVGSAACGSTTVSPQHPNAPQSLHVDASNGPLATFIHQAAEISCETFLRCPDQPTVNPFHLLVRDGHEMCLRFEERRWHARYREPLAAGRLRFDPMRAPLTHVTDSCHALTPRRMDDSFVGLVPVDGACQSSVECADGLLCDSSRNTCPGTCRAPSSTHLPPGAECRATLDCVQSASDEDVRCMFSPMSEKMLCLQVERVHDVQAGGQCGIFESGDYAGIAASCAAGLYCRYEDFRRSTAGVCSAEIAPGEPCRRGTAGYADTCVRGNICVASEANDIGVCRPMQWIDEEGIACGVQPSGVVLCNPYLGLSCEQGRCRRVVGDGQPRCHVEARFQDALVDASECATDQFCDDSSGFASSICNPKRPIGADCLSDDWCITNNCGENRRCGEPRARCY